MIIPEEIKRLREIYEASLPGEGGGDNEFSVSPMVEFPSLNFIYSRIWCNETELVAEVRSLDGISGDSLAECFVEARKALPKLLDEIEELQHFKHSIGEHSGQCDSEGTCDYCIASEDIKLVRKLKELERLRKEKTELSPFLESGLTRDEIKEAITNYLTDFKVIKGLKNL